jgi:hypothetical protein
MKLLLCFTIHTPASDVRGIIQLIIIQKYHHI